MMDDERNSKLPERAAPTIRQLHDKAMELAEYMMIARHEGDDAEVKRLALDAYKLEQQAAETLSPEYAHEPTRSILYRSAAWLALDAGLPQVAFDLAQAGMAGKPPAWAQQDLADVANEAWSRMNTASPQP